MSEDPPESRPPAPAGVDLSAETPAKTTGPVDLSSKEMPEEPREITTSTTLDPGLVLKFAKQILLGAAVFGVVFAVLALLGPALLLNRTGNPPTEYEKYVLTTGASIFDVVTTVIPPIITLVLGFYFGKKTPGP